MKTYNLTPKQETFCLAYLETGNATEAYRRAYSPKTKSDTSLWRMAKAVMDNIKVKSRIAELREPAANCAKVTLTEHINTLQRLRDLAEKEAKFDAAIKAEMAIGKVSGLYTEKLDLSSKDGTMSPKAAIDPEKLSTETLRELVNAAKSDNNSG